VPVQPVSSIDPRVDNQWLDVDNKGAIMNAAAELNRSLVTRMVKYQRVLRKLKSLGFVKVFSSNLADSLGITPALVRKDFSLVGIPGNKRGGYNIDTLAADLSKILGSKHGTEVIVVGCGRIGSALMNYTEFNKDGIKLIAGFDIHPERIKPCPIPVHPVSALAEYVKINKIRIGILAVPEAAATQVFDEMIQAGIRGIVNFTSVELKCGKTCDRESCARRCTIRNVNIGLELETLFYLTNLETMENLDFASSHPDILNTVADIAADGGEQYES
jgi:redox-sensing transcriptional repressor